MAIIHDACKRMDLHAEGAIQMEFCRAVIQTMNSFITISIVQSFNRSNQSNVQESTADCVSDMR